MRRHRRRRRAVKGRRLSAPAAERTTIDDIILNRYLAA